ncbi:hypothetical protein J437_LFUL015222 [Ladona fulva]|uniref:Uncharacterized protein n=1 Tax=Ladona fulva TaxID=123851 RepID=A0A8K0KJ17_LADFU|nr:hypothetical protein J437_LFUL015222 [Ladona fulva]
MKVSMLAHDIPEIPFNKIGVDIAEAKDKIYLIVDISTAGVIKVLKTFFGTHGIPEILIVYNNAFGSYEFKAFANNWKLSTVTTSPKYTN